MERLNKSKVIQLKDKHPSVRQINTTCEFGPRQWFYEPSCKQMKTMMITRGRIEGGASFYGSLLVKPGVFYDSFDQWNAQKSQTCFQSQALGGWWLPLPVSDRGARETTWRRRGTSQTPSFKPCLCTSAVALTPADQPSHELNTTQCPQSMPFEALQSPG